MLWNGAFYIQGIYILDTCKEDFPVPPLPKALERFSLLEIHGDACDFGGVYDFDYNLAIYQFICTSGICSWSTINQELKVGRYLTEMTVVIPVSDTFCV